MRFSRATLRRIHAINRIAPAACLASLLAAGVVLSQHATGDRAQAAARARGIRASLADMPFLAGDWVGTDSPLPAGATEILMPTAVLSRSFAELGSARRATLGIIHCGDVRDMHGHHPPACYPASGWHPREGGHDTVELALDARRFSANLYRFSSTDATGALREVSVIAFFVLPDGTITSDMSQLGSRAAKLEISRMGVGQIQVVMDGWPPVDEIQGVAQELLDIIPADCIRALEGLPTAATEASAELETNSRHVQLHGVSDASLRGSPNGEDQ